ncbi:unnamed protein product [Schistosoma curassoni]|uniref:Fructose-bisphosphatase n=1 Tax=Schistosoma curassoni TaxID=6186 RepID=A0A183JFN9_9TREM|nr:unnamed protein product [Schistosoma curassoni]
MEPMTHKIADDLALLSHTQQLIQEKMMGVAPTTEAVGLNIHKGKNRILRYNTTCNNRITLDGEALEDVKSFTYLGGIIDEHGGSDADVKVRIGKAGTAYLQLEGHLELKTIVDQYQGQNFQYKCQDSSTVWDGNLENYESHHPEDTRVY